ncbi:InlB B-repeat-containing protein [Roseibacillus ishigakijimensis]|uniref:VWA domain-containing protein n=1 Tax=Roseibacillus ishigakijimensis TaxID=454146 RepID=A0A934VMJ0_9BACT|nr:VWA domain-containing protein [Roseibacillus ishigakijimensis]MBK1834332.1 VWA domain-containing protein [Roseibacillus ishigakijimensis]
MNSLDLVKLLVILLFTLNSLLAERVTTQVVAWGNNANGCTEVPEGLIDVTSVSAGLNFALALKSDGTVVGWGEDRFGDLNGLEHLTQVTKISAGFGYSLALHQSGNYSSFGSMVESGVVNNEPPIYESIVHISAGKGNNHGLFTTLGLPTEHLKIWGYTGSAVYQQVPELEFSEVLDFQLGSTHALILGGRGELQAWGNNGNGQVTIPEELPPIQSISVGSTHNLALDAEGQIYAWGASNAEWIHPPLLQEPAIAISAGYSHSLAVTESGDVIAWGNDSHGRLDVPPDLGKAVAVTAGFDYSLALVERVEYKVLFFSVSPEGIRGTVQGDIEQWLMENMAAVVPEVTPPYGYRFIGWSEDTSSVTRDLMVYPLFEKLPVVTFVLGEQGTYLSGNLTQPVIPGSYARAPNFSVDEAWEYLGWDTTFASVTEDLVVTATYRRKPLVTFLPGEHGSITSGVTEQYVLVESDATAPTVSAGEGWQFTGWDTAFTNVTEDLLVTAIYARKPRVTFVAGDFGSLTSGTAIQYVVSGSGAVAPLIAEEEGWHFMGWDRDFTSVTEDIVVQAIYIRKPVVTFLAGENGTIVTGNETISLIPGDDAAAPHIRAHAGWTFIGWDTSFTNVHDDLTVHAQYAPWPVVTFHPGEAGTFSGGSAEQSVQPGGAATAPGITPATNWEFVGWDKPFDNVTEDLKVTARYKFRLPGARFTEPVVGPLVVPEGSSVTVAFRLSDEVNEVLGRGLNIPKEIVSTDDFFLVEEDGQEISLTESSFQVSKLDEADGLIKTVLMLDNSRSVFTQLGDLKEAAKRMVALRGERQLFAIYQFSEHPVLLQDFTSEENLLFAAIDSIERGASTTNLYGAALAGLEQWTDTYSLDYVERGYLVLFTDGSDQAALATEAEVLAARGDKQIFTIGLLNEETDTATLQALGSAGYSEVTVASDLIAVFSEIQQEIENDLNSFYWLNYLSPKRGDFERTLTVRLRENSYSGANSALNVVFNSAGFTEPEAKVTIQRDVFNLDGLSELIINSPGAERLEAKTILGYVDPAYEWELEDPTMASLEPIDGTTIQLVPRKAGVTYLTLTDGPNESLDPGFFSRTIEVTILASVVSQDTFGDLTASLGLTGNDALPGADPNADGIPNVLAYALELPLLDELTADDYAKLPHFKASESGDQGGLSFSLPDSPKPDVIYVVESAVDLESAEWYEIARLDKSMIWTGSAQVEMDGAGQVAVTSQYTYEQAPLQFLRLRILLDIL